MNIELGILYSSSLQHSFSLIYVQSLDLDCVLS